MRQGVGSASLLGLFSAARPAYLVLYWGVKVSVSKKEGRQGLPEISLLGVLGRKKEGREASPRDILLKTVTTLFSAFRAQFSLKRTSRSLNTSSASYPNKVKG